MQATMIRFIAAALLTLAAGLGRAENAIAIAEPVPVAAVAVSGTFGQRQAAQNLTNGSGLDGDRHDREGSAGSMWHTAETPAATSPAAGLPAFPAWVKFEFAQSAKPSEISLWNHNQNGLTNRGFRKTRIYGTADGAAWQQLAAVELKEGGDTAQAVAVSANAPLKAVIIAAESNWGGNVYGLSEVKLFEYHQVPASAAPFPQGLELRPQPFYRHRADGKPGREIVVRFIGGKLHGAADAEVTVAGFPGETFRFAADSRGASEKTVLLPVGAAVEHEAQVSVTIRSGNRSARGSAMVPALRRWTVYLVPHSHVDIGYTNTQDNVEFIHRRNIQEAIKLAKATADYPTDARYKWETEVSWPAERVLVNGTEEEKAAMLDAIRSGVVHVSAGYINDNTSVSAAEEFDAFFGPAERIGQLTGRKSDTLMQVDIPGMSWGVVTAAARHGVRYVLLFSNGGARVGHGLEMSHKPFWWIGPDGKTKVLCLQPGSYDPGAILKANPYRNPLIGQRDRSKLPAVIKSGRPREHFIDGYLWRTLAALERDPNYAYDIFPMSWSMCDNTPIDADLPDAVKSWNEDYAYPHLVIANSHDIMAAFEQKYGDKIPCRTGEFTEYWTDGLGTAAKQTSINRHTKERLIQADTLWSMLQPGVPAPQAAFDEAWRNVLMGSEHTWCYSEPACQPITNDILAVKFGYFQKADDDSRALLAAALKPVASPEGGTVTVFNTLSWPRTGLAALPADITDITDEAGKPVPTQKLSTGETVFLAQDVPALGARNYRTDRTDRKDRTDIVVTPTSLDNGIVKVTLDPATGDIASLIRDGREFVKSAANSYCYLKGGGAPSSATGPTEVKISIKENGPVLASLLVESKAEGCHWLRREVRILAGQPQVETINMLDKVAVNDKEGVHFGFTFDVPEPRTRMDIPFGVAEVDADFFPEANRNWICFQRWLDISGPKYGVTWTSPDAPTFEHGAITANILGDGGGSPAWLRRLQPSATVYSWALNNHWFTNFPLSQSGVLTFRYGILPHNSGYDAAAANRFGLEQARPLVVARTAKPAVVVPPVGIDNAKVVVSCIKAGTEGLVVTLRSLSSTPEKVTISHPEAKPAVVEMLPYGNATVTLKN